MHVITTNFSRCGATRLLLMDMEKDKLWIAWQDISISHFYMVAWYLNYLSSPKAWLKMVGQIF